YTVPCGSSTDGSVGLDLADIASPLCVLALSAINTHCMYVKYVQTACIVNGVAQTKHDVRSEATRRQLVTAARALFGARGYADVGTEEIVRAAGVTRGALYHQFRDKADLFAAVAEEIEAEIAERIAAGAADVEADPLQMLRTGAQLFLDACAEPEVERVILLDAPAGMGIGAWRGRAGRAELELVQYILDSG